MARRYTEIAFTDSVKETQERNGTRATAARVEAWDVDDRTLTEREKSLIASRDSFYMASVSETGWPYVQHRGGPPGFLRIVDDHTLAYADFRGNKQYVSMGNVEQDDRVALILMDYPNRARLKLYARSEVHDAVDRPDLVEAVADPDYAARIERVVVFRVEAFDWNCPQHITPRYTEAEIEALQAAR